MTARQIYLLLPLLILSIAVGCADKKFKTYAVTGKVTFEDGEPAQFGRIEFYQPDQDVTAYANIQQDGSFTLGTEQEADGAVEGDHQVMIMQMIMAADSGGAELVENSDPENADHGAHIDQTYADFASSGLTFTVSSSGSNVANFVVSRAKKP